MREKQTLKEFLKYSRNNTEVNIYYGQNELFKGSYEDFKKECKPLFGEYVDTWDACHWTYSDGRAGGYEQVDVSIEGNLFGKTWCFFDEENEDLDAWDGIWKPIKKHR